MESTLLCTFLCYFCQHITRVGRFLIVTIALFANLMSESVEGEALVAGDGGALVVMLPGG